MPGSAGHSRECDGGPSAHGKEKKLVKLQKKVRSPKEAMRKELRSKFPQWRELSSGGTHGVTKREG